MKIKQYELWLADLDPASGTEPSKIRPVVVVQTNLLNGQHPSTIICPITTKLHRKADILRIHLPTQLDKPSDILVDQPRATDNRRLVRKLGKLNDDQTAQLKTNLAIVLDL